MVGGLRAACPGGGRRSNRVAVRRCRAGRARWSCKVSVPWAAPLAAFVATHGGGRLGTAPRPEGRGRSEAEDGGPAAILLRDAKGRQARRKIAARAAIAEIGRAHV